MSFDPDRIYHELLKMGEAYADTKAAYELLDDLTKTLLAEIKRDCLASGENSSVSETLSLASPRYREHLAALAAARREYLHAQVKWSCAQTLSELRRSQESTNRAMAVLR